MIIGNVDGVDNDNVAGWALDPEQPTRHVPIDVLYNHRPLVSTTAAFHRDDLVAAKVGNGSNGFYVALPAISESEEALIEVRVAETGEPLGQPRRMTRRAKCSPTGVLARDMLALHRVPLYSVQGTQFDGATLVVSGIHLPPAGNPFALSVSSTAGVSFSFSYPHLAPSVRDWYWYWPNGAWSAFRIEVDLSATTHCGPHFEFEFHAESAEPEFTALQRNRFYVPKDVAVYQHFPLGDHLTRVQRFDSSARVALAGYTDYMRMAAAATEHGVDLASARVLDWGCGHGRVIRHFHQQRRVAETWAVDIDSENVGWLAANFPGISASAVPLVPPTDLPSNHFDLVYGISVMTHLTDDVQQAWLAELRRILKPGGIALLTFGGPASAAFASRFLTPAWFATWARTGFDDDDISQDLVDKIDDPEYYRNTKQTSEVTRERWSRHFDVVGLYECIFGYQDLAVLRRRD